MFQNRFDELYLTICKEVGGIEGLIKSFFDFLIRKTDFFYECDPGDKMGFPPGYSRKLLLNIFEQFQKEHYKRFPQKSPEQFNRKLEQFNKKKQQAQNKNIITQKQEQKIAVQKRKQPINSDQAKKSTQKARPVENTNKNQQEKQTQKNEDIKQHKCPQTVEKANQKKSEIDLNNTYNGGKNEKYSWSQESRQVQFSIQIQPRVKAKQLSVKIERQSISAKYKNQDRVIIQGQLYQKINTSQSLWKIQQLGGKNYLNFNLQKTDDRIWSTVFKGDPQIDTSKVNNSKPLHQFDQQTQGAIRKIMYEQKRKQQGLPTTQQEQQYQALKKAWDAQGSPFKGTPFDPSKLNLNGFKPE